MQQMHCNALFCHDIGLNVVYYMITYHCSEKGPFLGGTGNQYPSRVPIYNSGSLFQYFGEECQLSFRAG